MKKKKVFCFVGTICVLAAALLVLFLNQNRDSSGLEVNRGERIDSLEKLQNIAENLPENPQKENVREEGNPINFEELQKINKDIYGWIEIPDTTINYPILQGEENDAYYLNHTFDGKSGYPGSIYTERLNSKDMEDNHTVVYGHNMKDGQMFGALHNYEDEQFLSDHPIINIYLPNAVHRYEIFAAVEFSDRHLLNTYNFETEEDYMQFIGTVKSIRTLTSHIVEDVEISYGDKLLTLSTCYSGNKSNQRFLVIAKRIEN